MAIAVIVTDTKEPPATSVALAPGLSGVPALSLGHLLRKGEEVAGLPARYCQQPLLSLMNIVRAPPCEASILPGKALAGAQDSL
jgi:hypothetical protein